MRVSMCVRCFIQEENVAKKVAQEESLRRMKLSLQEQLAESEKMANDDAD